MCKGLPVPAAAQVAAQAPSAASSTAATAVCGSPTGLIQRPVLMQPVLMQPVLMQCVQQDGGIMCWPAQPSQQMAFVPMPMAVGSPMGSPQCAQMQFLSPEQLLPYCEASTGSASPASYFSSSSSDSGIPSDASNSAVPGTPGTPSDASNSAVPGAPGTASDASNSAALDVSLSDALEAGGERRDAAVGILQESILRRCMANEGCREVQLAFQVLDRKVLSELLTKLHGHAVALIKSPYGNYVMQKVIEAMPAAQVSFIAREVKGAVVAAAKHRYACRVLCRLLEHCNGEADVAEIVDELLVQADDLCRHPFAHHVIESVVEHGLMRHRHRVFEALSSDLLRNAADRRASFVMESALNNCSPADQLALAQALLSASDEGLLGLAQTRFGSHVVRALLKFPGIKMEAQTLWETKYGRRVLEEMGMSPAQGTLPVAAAAA